MSNSTTRHRTVKGRLYKRDRKGREHPATSRVKGGYWLQYTVKGKRYRRKLLHPDRTPITDIREAEAERDRILAPFTTADELEQLKAIEARLEEATARHEVAERKAVPDLLFESAWPAYLDSRARPDSGQGTLANYERHLRQFREWLASAHPEVTTVPGVTGEIAKDYAREIDGGRISANTYNKRINFLRLFYRIMVEEGRAEANPFVDIRRKRLQTNSRKELTVDQVYRLLSNARGELALVLGLGYFTGMRRGDCCTLRWSEVDLRRGIIKRIPNKSRTRSDNPTPVKIGIAGDLHNALSSVPPEQRSGYVLPEMAELYNSPNRRDRISRMITEHFERCGIRTQREGTGKYTDPETGELIDTGKRAVTEYGFHSLRYSYISHHAERGTPQAAIQANAGHRSPAMTEHYTRISDDAAREMAQVLCVRNKTPGPYLIDGKNVLGPKPTALPDWAVALVEKMDEGNWQEIKHSLLAGSPGFPEDESRNGTTCQPHNRSIC
jgi:integrase